nr:hypothetical protein [Thermoflexibacter sp.]
MRNLIFLLAVYFVSDFLYAQAPKNDSLEQQLATSQLDTHRVNLLNQLAWKYIASNPTKTLKYAKESLQL